MVQSPGGGGGYSQGGGGYGQGHHHHRPHGNHNFNQMIHVSKNIAKQLLSKGTILGSFWSRVYGRKKLRFLD